MLDRINPIAILEKAAQAFEDFANMFQYTPQIYDFLTTEWNWHEVISLLISYPLSMFYHFRYALIAGIFSTIISGIIYYTIRKIFN